VLVPLCPATLSRQGHEKKAGAARYACASLSAGIADWDQMDGSASQAPSGAGPGIGWLLARPRGRLTASTAARRGQPAALPMGTLRGPSELLLQGGRREKVEGVAWSRRDGRPKEGSRSSAPRNGNSVRVLLSRSRGAARAMQPPVARVSAWAMCWRVPGEALLLARPTGSTPAVTTAGWLGGVRQQRCVWGPTHGSGHRSCSCRAEAAKSLRRGVARSGRKAQGRRTGTFRTGAARYACASLGARLADSDQMDGSAAQAPSGAGPGMGWAAGAPQGQPSCIDGVSAGSASRVAYGDPRGPSEL
jgi:hypothetical protein